MRDFAALGASALGARVQAGEVSASEVTRAALDRIAARDPALGACTAVQADAALADAAAVDARIARGEPVGPLAGAPFVAKNLFDIAGVTTLAGARMRLDAPAAARDATAVARLKAAGAILVATTNTDEFAYGFTTENSHFGVTRNPRDPARLAGGSSGGSAAAVAAGFAPLALGSDTNGSIRIPAAFCGVWGLKPTFGRLSRAGAWPFVASLDHIGPMARSVADLALAYDVLQGPDPADPACTTRAPEPASADLAKGAAGLRVGVLGGWFRRGAQDCALEAVDAAASVLSGQAEVMLAESDLARAAAFLITAAEGANLHLEDLRRRPEAFDPGVRDRLLAGALLPAALVIQAHRFRRRYQRAAAVLFRDYDILLAPAAPCRAIGRDQRVLEIEGVEMLARAHIGIYTQPISLIGLPVVTAPVPLPGGPPLGVQIVAAPWCEAHALRAAGALERAGVAAAPVAPWRPEP